MTDLNVSNSSRNILSREQSPTHPKFVDSSEVFDGSACVRSSKFKSAPDRTSYYNSNCKKCDEFPSPGIDVSASTMFENTYSDENFTVRSTDDCVKLDSNNCVKTCGQQSTKYNITDEMDPALYLNTSPMKPKVCVSSSSAVKYSNQSLSPASKTQSSSNFIIFGQLLNRRPNSSLVSKSSGNTSDNSPFKSKQSSPQSSKNEVLSLPESDEGLQRAQMKTKLRSMWNNVKYGWRIKREVQLKTDSAVWLLGQCYHNKLSDGAPLAQDVAEQLRLDLLSKIWLTYRINFPAIPGTNLISDSGWGCMLRCGQMMMAQAFVCHFLQRDWRLSSGQPETKNELYKMILRWFGDSMSAKSPFSLHHLVSLGENYGRKAGDWYGPTHAAHVLRDALVEARKHNPLLQQLCMYVASDGIVFKQDVIDLCMNFTSQAENSQSTFSSEFSNISPTKAQGNSCSEGIKDKPVYFATIPSSDEEEINGPTSFENACPSYSDFGPPSYGTVKSKWKSLILFVSVRLGNDKINPFYIPCLKSLLAYEHCIGIIGGRPKHALYFIGWQDEKVIHMDPHSCQPAVDVEKEDFNEKSFHSSSVRTMSFNEMDPSCAIGFYFREFEEFQFFVEKFSEITAPLKRNLEYPVFALADGKRAEIEGDVPYPNEKCIYSHMGINPNIEDDDDDDDYILL